MSGRLLVFAIIVGLGAAGAWWISQTSPPGAVIFGLSMLLVAVLAFFGARRSAASSGDGKKGGKLPPQAVALRQSRAMSRAEDGEISGLPGGPA